jgi:TetR/AcrR family transcriptional regulator, acrAB operon repressor
MRRTKEDSQKTRQLILRSARAVFAERGVSKTTMEQIAAAAGVTRGAIYGHFANKSSLFFAMREQVALPMIDSIDNELFNSPDDPLIGVERYLKGVLAALESDLATRETFYILGFKCEYVGEFERDMKRQASRCKELTEKLEHAYQSAARNKKLRAGLQPELAALETCAFLVGLIRLWLLDRGKKLVKPRMCALIEAHVGNLRGPGQEGVKQLERALGRAQVPGLGPRKGLNAVG